jgi:hypothetical protein
MNLKHIWRPLTTITLLLSMGAFLTPTSTAQVEASKKDPYHRYPTKTVTVTTTATVNATTTATVTTTTTATVTTTTTATVTVTTTTTKRRHEDDYHKR